MQRSWTRPTAAVTPGWSRSSAWLIGSARCWLPAEAVFGHIANFPSGPASPCAALRFARGRGGVRAGKDHRHVDSRGARRGAKMWQPETTEAPPDTRQVTEVAGRRPSRLGDQALHPSGRRFDPCRAHPAAIVSVSAGLPRRGDALHRLERDRERWRRRDCHWRPEPGQPVMPLNVNEILGALARRSVG